MIVRCLAVVVVAALVSAMARGSPEVPRFTDITPGSGIDFRHMASKTAVKFLPETMGGGVALLDYDGDGRLDVFFTNGAALDSEMSSARAPDKGAAPFWNRLYRQTADGRFEDVTARAGVAGHRYDFGAATGDFDNDGHVDLYVTGYGGNTLYRNRGDGSFTDITAAAGVAAGGWSSSAAFVDVDRDGQLDLFVCRYLDWSWEDNPVCPASDGSGRAYCHPRLFPPVTNILYRNNGDGTFRDVSREAGMAAHAGKALGVAIDDYDGDGHVDLFVANDSIPQFLFRNRGDGTFAEVAVAAGVAFDEDGRTFAGMGTDFGDYDGDGRPDLIVTTLSLERYALYRNDGADGFAYTTHVSGVGRATARGSGWGTRLFDYDNDGDVDLFVAQGHVLDTVSVARQGYGYEQPPLLLRNDDGRFTDVSGEMGAPFKTAGAGRGAAVGDLDNDGDLDVIVSNLDGPPVVLRNDATAGRSLLVRLRGTRSNRDGIGATLILTDARGRTQRATASRASSYQSANDGRVHFGLGVQAAHHLEVRWPSGIVQSVPSLPAHGEVLVEESPGAGAAAGAAEGQATDPRARDAYRRAVELEARGDANAALALLWTASGIAPRDVEIQTRLAEALQRVGALDSAIDAWRAAHTARPNDRRAARGLVLALVAAGRSSEAVTLARAAVDKAPGDPDTQLTLGLAQSEQDVDAALESFTRVLARTPHHTLARYNLALVLKRLDRLDDAIAELQRVIASEPRPEAHYALGAAWWHRGDAARATAALQAAIDAEPRHAEAHQMLGVVRAAQRDWIGAASALRRALALRPDVAGSHETLARVLRASGDEAGARRHSAEGERLRRQSEREHEARVWTSLGTVRLEQGEAVDALDAFRRAIAISETYAAAHFQMGRALDRLGEAEAADGAYARAQALNPHLVRPPRETAADRRRTLP